MKQQRGFTLVELIVVIVLTGIMAGSVAIFFKPAIDSYFATQRRAVLADTADTAVRRMAREIRSAVPNSILEHDTTCIEFVPSIAGGRFRMAAHVNPPAPLATENIASACQADASCSLDLTAPTFKQTFDVLQLSQSRPPAAGDFVVIGNQQPEQVYGGSNRQAISGIPALTAPAATYGTHRIALDSSGGSLEGARGYDMGRFSVAPASGSVSFVCAGTGKTNGRGTGKLYRVTRPLGALGAAMPDSCPGTGGFPVLADNVESCKFLYSSNVGTQQNGLAWMEITLTDADESVNLAFGAHVSNVP